jgi:hypothetical protein
MIFAAEISSAGRCRLGSCPSGAVRSFIIISDSVPGQRVPFRRNPQPARNARITAASISRQFRKPGILLGGAGRAFAAQGMKEIGAAHGRPGLFFALFFALLGA